MKATAVLSLVLAILIAIFALLNGTNVPVSFGFAKLESSLALVILVSVATGAIFIYLIDFVGKLKSARKVKALEKQVTRLEKEIDEKNLIIAKLSQVEKAESTQKKQAVEMQKSEDEISDMKDN